ncbi:MAG TPA: phosphatase PAP2 family protein [Pirellulales bacterium]|jgi:membrane-associated phospholipid phosphatase|nr:phosphatase PAP2 family protein [Pirellulales bacterium]
MADGNLLLERQLLRGTRWRRIAGAMLRALGRVPLSRDSAVKWAIVAAMILVDAVLFAAKGLEFPPSNALLPLVYIALLAVPAVYYYRRRELNFVLCLTTLILTIAFLPPFTLLMYATATLGRPLVDATLADCDRWLGVSVPAIRDWTLAHPAVQLIFDLAYGGLLYQLPLIVIVLGLRGERRRLENFVLQDMLAALITLSAFAFVPAAGPFAHYGYEPSADQSRYLEHFHGLRGGERRVVNLHDAEGLVTCPSFHTSEAILMALAFRGHRIWFAVFGTLNLLVAASTMTTGWHYFTDVLAGVAVALLAMGVVRWATPWRYASVAEFARIPAVRPPDFLRSQLRDQE